MMIMGSETLSFPWSPCRGITHYDLLQFKDDPDCRILSTLISPFLIKAIGSKY